MQGQAPGEMIQGFGPIEGPNARVLILGTVPSVRSLELGQYYGHPQNAFWPIMSALFAEGERLDYPSRVAMLTRSRVAVWDVLHLAERPGSMDAAIVAATAVPNDIRGFLAAHAEVSHVMFNGAKAQELFARHIGPAASFGDSVQLLRLPSTSPANASATFEQKLAAWRVVRDVAEAGTGR